MLLLGPRVVYSVMFYGLAMTLLIVSKPSYVFDRNGAVRGFGAGPHKTMYSLGVVSIVGAIFCFYIFAMLDMIFQ